MSMEEGKGPARRVPFCRPDITEAEIQEVAETIRSGWITTGPKVKRFESAFAEAVQAPWAVAVSSCTAGLHTSLVALGCREGTEVITTAYTFTSSAAAIILAGARPVVVDVEEETFNIDPDHVERVLGPRTRAILPVHIAGHPAEMDRLLEIAASRGVAVVEDAAHAIPAAYRGQPVGSIGDLTCFSFYATKNLTTGEGGMITGKSEELREKVARIGYHGWSKDAWKRYSDRGSWAYEILEQGFKYNLSDVAAAMGLGQLARLPEMQARRREVVRRYDEAFRGLEPLILPVARPHVEHAWHLYVIRLRPGALRLERKGFIEALADRGIGTSVHFIPLQRHRYYRETLGLDASDYPVSERVFESCISLPLFSSMTDDEVDQVIDAVGGVVRENLR